MLPHLSTNGESHRDDPLEQARLRLRAYEARFEFPDDDGYLDEPPLEDDTQTQQGGGDTDTQIRRDAGTQQKYPPTAPGAAPTHPPSSEELSRCVSVFSVSPPPSEGKEDDFLVAVMVTVREDARQGRLPPAADRYYSQQLKLLIGLCWRLQEVAEKRPFYLSCRDAGRLLGGVSYQQADRWLLRLARDSIITCVSKGSKGTGLASQYRFTAKA
jgi:hypothetical protein